MLYVVLLLILACYIHVMQKSHANIWNRIKKAMSMTCKWMSYAKVTTLQHTSHAKGAISIHTWAWAQYKVFNNVIMSVYVKGFMFKNMGKTMHSRYMMMTSLSSKFPNLQHKGNNSIRRDYTIIFATSCLTTFPDLPFGSSGTMYNPPFKCLYTASFPANAQKQCIEIYFEYYFESLFM